MRPIIKAIFLLLMLLAAIALIHLTPIRHSLEDVHAVGARIKALGWWSPVAFTAMAGILISVGVPRLLVCSISGMAFGFFWGLMWSQMGTLLGYYATFLFVRWSGRDYVLKKWPKLNRYQEFFKVKGILIVLLIRQMPIAGFYINIVLGLTHIRHANFLLGTVVGILPEAIPATMIGAGVLSLSPSKSIAAISIAVVFFIIVWTVVGRYLRSPRFKFISTANDAVGTGKDETSA